MDDRRKHERKPTCFYSEVSDLATGRTIGHLTGISRGGMMVIGETKLTVGEELKLWIELPRDSAITSHLEVTARVRWSQSDMSPGLFAAGLEFEQDEHPDAEAIDQLCRIVSEAV